MDEIVMTQGTEVLAFAGYQAFVLAADRTAVKIKEGFMEMGYILKTARDTDILHGSEYGSHEEFAEKRYGLDKGTVSRYIRIVERFSVGGNSHILQDSYRNVGFAKLSLMLHLSDEVAEELMDRYSKAEVQMVKEEIEAEQAISEIELAIEKAEMDPEEQQDAGMLGLAVRQLGREQPDMYRKLWHIKRTHPVNAGSRALMEVFAPEGNSIHIVRIPGTGRLMLSISEDDSVSVINVRSNAKEKYDMDELAAAVDVIINSLADSAEESYLKVYGEPLQSADGGKAEVAPVQPAREKRRQSKVIKSKPRGKQPAAVVQPEPREPEGEQTPGQMSINDYPEILPVSYEEIKEDPKDADDGSNEAAGGRYTGAQGSAGNDGKILSDVDGSSNDNDDDVVSGGFGTAGAAGESGKISEPELVTRIDDACHRLSVAVHGMTGVGCTEEDVQRAYHRAINLAAAIEQLLLLRQKERKTARNG